MNLFENKIFKILAVVLASVFITSVFMGAVKKEEIESGISSKVLRLHVRAKSNSVDDQSLKLKVRDNVLAVSEEILSDCQSKEESIEKIKENMETIETAAQQTVYENGKTDKVKVYLRDEIFPVRKYGNLVFPAGKYTAVAVEIGGGKGKNWWCVMYPHICFIDESVEGEEKEIKHIFSDEEYNLITGSKKPSVAFKTVEIIEDLF